MHCVIEHGHACQLSNTAFIKSAPRRPLITFFLEICRVLEWLLSWLWWYELTNLLCCLFIFTRSSYPPFFFFQWNEPCCRTRVVTPAPFHISQTWTSPEHLLSYMLSKVWLSKVWFPDLTSLVHVTHSIVKSSPLTYLTSPEHLLSYMLSIAL